jgi:hypothetical protein
MGCYGRLGKDAFLSDADSAADMELDDAAGSARPTHHHQQQTQQHQRTLQWLVASSSSMGTQELAKAAAAAAAGNHHILLCSSNSDSSAAERKHAGIMQTLLQQVLIKAAVQRKRGAVLQAGPEAGSRSVRARLLITELAVYSSSGKPLVQAVPWLHSVGAPISCGCSAADLSLSNSMMSSIKLPGEWLEWLAVACLRMYARMAASAWLAWYHSPMGRYRMSVLAGLYHTSTCE